MKSLFEAYVKEVLADQLRIQPQSKIFCDMDGVVVDYERGAEYLINNFLNKPQFSSESSMKKTYDKLVDELGADYRVVNRSDLRRFKSVRNISFGLIARNPGIFLRSLPSLKDGVGVLWPFLNSTHRGVTMLTAGITGDEGTMSSTDGKKEWVAKHLRPAPAGFILCPASEKRRYAVTNGIPNVWVDDRAETITGWNKDGGIGVLHITGQSERTVEKLKSLGF